MVKVVYVAGHDGCWGEGEKYQAAAMANKAAMIEHRVVCYSIKFIIRARFVIFGLVIVDLITLLS